MAGSPIARIRKKKLIDKSKRHRENRLISPTLISPDEEISIPKPPITPKELSSRSVTTETLEIEDTEQRDVNEVMQSYANIANKISATDMAFGMLSEEKQTRLMRLLHEKVRRIGNKCATRYEFVNRYHRTHQGKLVEFSNRLPLLKLYQDEHPFIVVRKAVQVGVSEWAIADSMYMALEKGWSGAYILTKSQLRNSVVAERVNKLFVYVPYYKENLGTTNSLRQKSLGKGVIYYLGSNAEDDFISFPADFIIVDELDRCDENNLALVPDRLQASEHKYQRYISNPTIQHYGIDAYYEKSDKKRIMLPCISCRHWQSIEWFTHVVREIDTGVYVLRDTTWNPHNKSSKLKPVCVKCDTPIFPNWLLGGQEGMLEWIAEHPDRTEYSGYWMTQIYSPTVTFEEMWEDFCQAHNNPSKMQIFYNSRLGLPYKPEGQGFSQSTLATCTHSYIMPAEYTGADLVVAGIDVGKKLNVVVRVHKHDGTRVALYLGKVPGFEHLDELFVKYAVQVACIDAQPELHKVNELQEKYNFVYKVYYSDTLANISINKDTRIIRAPRTASIDSVLHDVMTKKLVNPLYAPNIPDYYDEMCASTRIAHPTRNTFEWVHSSPDDYLHAEVYAKLGEYVHTEPQIHIFTSETVPRINVDTSQVHIINQVLDLQVDPIYQFLYS